MPALAPSVVESVAASESIFKLLFPPMSLVPTAGPVEPVVYTSRGRIIPATVFGTSASAANTTVITGVVGKRIFIWGVMLIAGAAVTPTLMDGNRSYLDSAFPLTSNTGVFPTVKDVTSATPVYVLTAGNSLILVTDSVGPLYYWFKYTQE